LTKEGSIIGAIVARNRRAFDKEMAIHLKEEKQYCTNRWNKKNKKASFVSDTGLGNPGSGCEFELTGGI